MAFGDKKFKRYCNYFTSYDRDKKVKVQDNTIKVIYENEIEGKKGKFTALSIVFEDGREVTGVLSPKKRPVRED
jgi:hypothetical protein